MSESSSAYINAYIEQCATFGWQGGPNFMTRIVTMRNGRERRNADRSKAIHSYTVPFLNINQEGYSSIKQMHYVCMGMLRCFKFRDELDYTLDNEVFGTGNGVQTVFQLIKQSTLDGVTYQREITVPEPGMTFTSNNVPATPTVDYDRGFITYSVAPGNGVVLRATGTFAMWVRFNQDDLPFSIDNPDAINGSITVIEQPPPP